MTKAEELSQDPKRDSDFQELPWFLTTRARSKDSSIRNRNTVGGFARGTRDECLRKRYVDGLCLHISVPFPISPTKGGGGCGSGTSGRRRRGGDEKHLLRTSVNTRCSVYFRATSPVSYYIRIADPVHCHVTRTAPLCLTDRRGEHDERDGATSRLAIACPIFSAEKKVDVKLLFN